MYYSSIRSFVNFLEEKNDLLRIAGKVSTDMEITEIADRFIKSNGKALLFENNETEFDVLINSFGSEQRILDALRLNSFEEFAERVEQLTDINSLSKSNFFKRVKELKKFKQLLYLIPKKLKAQKNARCFDVVMPSPNLFKIPILKCWPHDGGRFITLPMVHTKDCETGMVNVGMYRMQVFDEKTTGMHWHKHKGGAAHFDKYLEQGTKMPVVVTIGGDPVYSYCASAPLPEMITEYAFVGFLRKKRVKLVKCLTCDIEIPEDVDFVIEGYIDPSEKLRTEGPFGDHTGFYSLPDEYPVFHITSISHRKDAIYHTTIVGVPPMEDAFMGKATERLFLPLIKKLIIPEIVDMYLPVEGGFHNLAIVSINNKYPGQAVKVMCAMWGAGQLMFVKNIIVVDETINIRNPEEVASVVLTNSQFPNDFHFMNGPLDVLDHANTSFAFGKKMGIDACNKGYQNSKQINDNLNLSPVLEEFKALSRVLFKCKGKEVVAVFFDKKKGLKVNELHNKLCENNCLANGYVLYFDFNCYSFNNNLLMWILLANFNPERDFLIIKKEDKFFIGFDGSIKTVQEDSVKYPSPNVIYMSEEIINYIDNNWERLNLGKFIDSPSRIIKKITPNKGYLFE